MIHELPHLCAPNTVRTWRVPNVVNREKAILHMRILWKTTGRIGTWMLGWHSDRSHIFPSLFILPSRAKQNYLLEFRSVNGEKNSPHVKIHLLWPRLQRMLSVVNCTWCSLCPKPTRRLGICVVQAGETKKKKKRGSVDRFRISIHLWCIYFAHVPCPKILPWHQLYHYQDSAVAHFVHPIFFFFNVCSEDNFFLQWISKMSMWNCLCDPPTSIISSTTMISICGTTILSMMQTGIS